MLNLILKDYIFTRRQMAVGIIYCLVAPLLLVIDGGSKNYWAQFFIPFCLVSFLLSKIFYIEDSTDVRYFLKMLPYNTCKRVASRYCFMVITLISSEIYLWFIQCVVFIIFVNEIMEEGGMTISPITNSGNIVIDSLIGYWYVTAQKQEIDFSVNMNIPMKMPFKGADICLIIGNLLENAVEAAKKVVGKKYIKVQMKYDKGNFLFFVKNNYNGKLLKTKNDRLRSTKLDAGNHGLGLPSVYRAAAKYHGSVFIDDSTPELFQVHVVLYGEQE